MNYGSGSRLPIHPILKQELSGPDLCVQHSEKGEERCDAKHFP